MQFERRILMEEGKLVNDKGIRLDGRKVDELRPIKLEAGVLKSGATATA